MASPQSAERSTGLLAGPDGKLAAVYGAAALAALVLALAFFVGYQAGQKALWGFTGAALWLALFLGLAVVALRARQPALLLAFLVLDLFTMNASHHATPADQVNLTPHRALAAVPLADRDLFRTANDDVLPNNYGLLYNLEDIRGASPLRLKDYDEWLARVPLPRAWKLLGVKYVFSWLQELDAPAERLAEEPGRDNKPVYLYRLKETGPRAVAGGPRRRRAGSRADAGTPGCAGFRRCPADRAAGRAAGLRQCGRLRRRDRLADAGTGAARPDGDDATAVHLGAQRAGLSRLAGDRRRRACADPARRPDLPGCSVAAGPSRREFLLPLDRSHRRRGRLAAHGRADHRGDPRFAHSSSLTHNLCDD